MKKTGLSRRIDDLGRVTIPKEIRDDFNLFTGDSIDFSVEGRKIIMQKNERACVLCQNKNPKELVNFEDSKICNKCLKKIFNGFKENKEMNIS